MDLKQFADKLIRRSRLVTCGIILMTLVSIVGVSRMGFDDNPRAVFRTNDADFHLMEEVFEQFGTDENNCYFLVRSDELFSRHSLNDLQELTNAVARLDGIESVQSVLDPRLVVFDPLPHPVVPQSPATITDDDLLQRARREALQHPLVAGQLLSEDGNHTLVIARLLGEALEISDIQPLQVEMDAVAARFSQQSSLDVRVTGIPAIRVNAFTLVQEESQRFTILCAFAAIVMAVVILRCWQMVVVVCVAALTGTLWTVGTLGMVGEDITVLTVVLPMLVMVVAFTDSMHLVVDVRTSRAAGLPPLIAARDALRHLTVACGLTSFTTAVGFASLSVTRTEIIRRFGLACGFGAVVTFVAVITIVPVLAATPLGMGMLPPHRGRRFDSGVSNIGEVCIQWVLRYRWPITIVSVVCSILMSISAWHLEPQHEIAENLPDNSPATKTLHEVDKYFGGMLPSVVVVDWPADVQQSSASFRQALQAVHQACQDSPATHYPFSVLNVMQSVPGVAPELLPLEATRRLVREDLRRAVVVCRSKELGAAFYSREFPELSQNLAALQEQHPGYRFRLTGSAVVGSRNLSQMIVDLTSSLGLATVVIFITLTLVFRSVRIGLICLIPNALPLLLTASLLVWTGESLRFSSVIVFCVCLGIAVDDTIHVVNRFQREMREVNDVNEAVRRSMKAVGAALVITTVVLIVGFSITLTSAIPGNRMFGLLSCTAIAAALLGDLVVLPAMLSCFVRPKDAVTKTEPAAELCMQSVATTPHPEQD